MPDELAAGDAFFYQRLSASSALTALVGSRIYNAEKVPPLPATGTPPDYVSWQFMSGIDRRTIDGVTTLVNSLWTVKAVCYLLAGNAHARAGAIVEALGDELAGVKAITIGGVVFMAGCVREGRIRYIEPATNPQFLHWGASFRVFLDA